MAGLTGIASANDAHSVQPGGSIQDAVTSANSGDTIRIASGMYKEQSVFVDKSITIVGDPGTPDSTGPGSSAPVLDGGDTQRNAFVLASGLSDVTIEGLEIRNYGVLEEPGGNGIVAQTTASDISVRDNYIHSIGNSGVATGPPGREAFANWVVQRNVIEDFPTTGIRIGCGRNVTIVNNDITGGTGYTGGGWNPNSDFPGNGIHVPCKRSGSVTSDVTAESITVEGNTITGPFFIGVQAHAWNANQEDAPVVLRDVAIRENNISDATGGISAISSEGALLADVDMVGNTISDCRQLGIYTGVLRAPASHGRITISENEIRRTRDSGIGLNMSSGSIDIRRNDITENGTGVQSLQSHRVAGTHVVSNNITDNANLGVENAADDQLDATENWWGHASGPGGSDGRTNPAGKSIGRGDDIEGNVAFDPWRRSSVDT